MSSTEARNQQATGAPPVAHADTKLEVVVIPVRAREGVLRAPGLAPRRRLLLRQRLPDRPVHPARFALLGAVRDEHVAVRPRLGAEHVPGRRGHRGRAGRARRARRRGQRGVPPRGVLDQFRADPSGHVAGTAPDRQTYGSFASFSDPDGNVWLLQEITTRLPGRIDANATSFATIAELAGAMRRAEAAHGVHESRTGVRDENWPEWYAAYMVAEQAGTELPT